MRTTCKPAQWPKKGYALVVTLLFLVVTTITLTSVWLWTANNGSITQRNINFNQSAAAAEAATEKVFTTMDRDFLNGSLNTSNQYNNSLNNSMLPDTGNTNLWPIAYTFSDTNGTADRTFVSIGETNFEALNSQYSGLQGLVRDCTIISVATPVGQRYTVAATVKQTFQASLIPVFQFAIFYNLNLEMDPGQPQDVHGPVFCNANIWEGNANLTFDSPVQAVGTNYTWQLDPFSDNYPASGDLTTAYSGTPLANFALGAPSDHNNSLTMPIGNSTNSNPTNVESILNLPPIVGGQSMGAPNTIAYAESNQVYLFNESDLIISNAVWGTNGIATNGFSSLAGVNSQTSNITIWFQDRFNTPSLKKLTNDLVQLKLTSGTWTNTASHTGGLNSNNYQATNILYAGFSFITNVTFTDYRESDTVQALQIDIKKFRFWLTNNLNGGDEGYRWDNVCSTDLGHRIWSIYAYNSVPFSPTQLPAVRLVNGGMLPTNGPGLTVSTPMPLYIYGNYNVSNNLANDLNQNVTTHTYPAAVLADAITILSTNWNDSVTTTLPNAGNTTINAAMLEGIVQTVTNISGDYSGGVENFMRLLEDWTKDPSGAGNRQSLTYNGSIVVMFPSIYATNHWQNTGNYYNAPTRHWAFDLNFNNASGLPPLTPESRALIRNSWSAY
jgi:hypothetical protein